MNLLILQPIRPNHPEALRQRADAALRNLAIPDDWVVTICQDDTPITPPPSPSIYAKHAAVRNHMLDHYLKPEHNLVLWIDSDLIDYPSDLIALLYTANPGGIAAPFVFLDKHPGRFYDIGGFIESGRRFGLNAPYCRQTGDVVSLDSVGCLYLAPASLYHAGARYSAPPTDYYVEHWSVMQQAKQRGLSIVGLRNVIVTHAYLPMFGLPLN